MCADPGKEGRQSVQRPWGRTNMVCLRHSEKAQVAGAEG
jgi:hypothetical protein